MHQTALPSLADLVVGQRLASLGQFGRKLLDLLVQPHAIVDGIVNGAGVVTKFIAVVSSKFDSIVVDGLVNFTAFTAGISGRFLRTVQTGKVQTYIIFAIVGMMALVMFYIG